MGIYCPVERDLARHLSSVDHFEALETCAFDDWCEKYLEDAFESLDESDLSEEDWVIVSEVGDYDLLSDKGKMECRGLAHKIAEQDGYSRYV